MGRLSSFSRALLIVAYVGLMVGCVGWRPSMDTVLWGNCLSRCAKTRLLGRGSRRPGIWMARVLTG